MSLRIYRRYASASLLLASALVGSACSPSSQGEGTPLAVGLDHIPVAVVDLDSAVEQYRTLGFTLKPGRPHENSIQNYHCKFPDGTEIEIISAREARDPLAAEYLRFLGSGDGAAFVGFYAPDMDQLADRLDAGERDYRYEGGLLTFPEPDELRYIFFGQRNGSPTDRPKYFEHLNGAEALIGIWIAGDDLTAERQLLADLGGAISEEPVHVPDHKRGTVATLEQAEVVFLPGFRQLVPGRRIVGAIIRTHDLDALQRVLQEASWDVPPVVETTKGHSMFVPPSMTHGIWLEFRQDGGG